MNYLYLYRIYMFITAIAFQIRPRHYQRYYDVDILVGEAMYASVCATAGVNALRVCK